MKSIYKYVAILLLATSFFGTNVKKADAYFYCSPNETRCASAFLNYGLHKEISSKSVYFSKGETIEYQWQNVSPGIQHVAFAVYSGTTQITAYAYAPANGNEHKTYPAPSSGYYFLYALCQGGGDNRCEGGGRISPQ